MAGRLMRRLLLLAAVFLALASTAELPGQEPGDPDSKSVISGANPDSTGLRTEIEPGVVVFGKPHRFTDVGNCQSFDSSPDGRTLVFASGQLKLFDLVENKVVDEIGEPREYYQNVAYSPDGRLVLTHFYQGGGPDQTPGSVVRVFDAIDGSPISRISSAWEDGEKSSTFYIQQLTVSADGNYVGLQSHNALQVREIDSGDLILGLKDQSFVQGIAFSSDEESLFVSTGGKIKVFDLDSGEPLTRGESKLANSSGNFIAVNLAQDLVATCTNSRVSLFQGDGKSKGAISMPSGSRPQRVAFSDDGSRLAIAAWAPQASGRGKIVLHVADVERKNLLTQVDVQTQGLTKMMFAADNQSLFVTGHGIYGALEVKLDEEPAPANSKFPLGPMTMAAIHPDNESFVTCTSNGELSWFDVETGEVKQSIQQPNVNSLMITDDGSELIIGKSYFGGQPITRLSYRTGKSKKNYSVNTVPKGRVFDQIKSFIVGGRPSNQINHVQLMPLSVRSSVDGSEINSLFVEIRLHQVENDFGSGSSYEQKMFLKFSKLDAESGKQLASNMFPVGQFGFQENEWPQSGSVRPNGSQFAVAPAGKLKIIDAETGEIVNEFPTAGQGYSNSFGFSPNGELIHSADHQSLTVWDADTGDQAFRVDLQQGAPVIAYSKSGSYLASCQRGKDSDVVVYNTRNWSQAYKRSKTVSDRTSLAFSPDGAKLLIGLRDCRMELWDLAALPR